MSTDPSGHAEATTSPWVVFSGYAFDTTADLLTKEGNRVHLPPQPAKMLGVFVRSGGRLVTRDELRDAIWGGDRFAEFDQGLNYCIRQIRIALEDNAETPRFIETVPRRGYRFLPSVTPLSPQPRRRMRWRNLAVAAIAVIAVAAILGGGMFASTQDTLDGPVSREVALARSLPTADRVRFLKAVRLMDSRGSGAYAAARLLLDSVVLAQPSFVPAQVRQSEAQLWSGDVDGARANMDRLLALMPGEARLHTLRGALALFRDWDVALSLQHMMRGASLAPESSMAQHYLSYSHMIAGDTSAARRAIDRALALDPLSPTLNGDAAMVYYWLRDYASAELACERGATPSIPSRAVASCQLLIAAARGNFGALRRAAAYLARTDSAPAWLIDSLSHHSSAPSTLQLFYRWELSRLTERDASANRGALSRARLHVLLGEPDSASRVIEAGLQAPRSNDLLYATLEPLLDSLRDRTTLRRISAALGRPSPPGAD